MSDALSKIIREQQEKLAKEWPRLDDDEWPGEGGHLAGSQRELLGWQRMEEEERQGSTALWPDQILEQLWAYAWVGGTECEPFGPDPRTIQLSDLLLGRVLLRMTIQRTSTLSIHLDKVVQDRPGYLRVMVSAWKEEDLGRLEAKKMAGWISHGKSEVREVGIYLLGRLGVSG